MPLDNFPWTKFLGELRKRKCCLLLGPEIKCLQSGNDCLSVLGAFADYMGTRLHEEQVVFDPNVRNFYYRANKFINNKYAARPYQFEEEIQLFSTNTLAIANPTYFEKLVRLPFNSIVSMVPDNFVANTLTSAGYDFIGEHYDYRDPTKKNLDLAEEMQLVYNMFGSYDFPRSVAVTEKDQLTQIKTIVAHEPGVPFQVTNRFKDETKSFLFLGFDFNDWHFRLVIDALQIPRPNFSFYPIYTTGHQVALMTMEFYNERFGIQFVEPDTDIFLEQLINQYEGLYGSLDRKLSCVLDYHEENIEQFRVLKGQLQQNGIASRMDFSNREEGQSQKELDDKVSAADVYIPFISSSFIANQNCLARAKAAIGQAHTTMIPVITGYTSYENAIPGIRQKKLMVLPRDGKALSSYPPNDLTQVCYELAKTINRIIR